MVFSQLKLLPEKQTRQQKQLWWLKQNDMLKSEIDILSAMTVKFCDFPGIWCNKDKRTETKTLEAGQFFKIDIAREQNISFSQCVCLPFEFYQVLFDSLTPLSREKRKSQFSILPSSCMSTDALPLLCAGERVCSLPSSQLCVPAWTNWHKDCFHPPIATEEGWRGFPSLLL